MKEVEKGGQVEEGDQAECLNEFQEPDDNKIDGIREDDIDKSCLIFCDFYNWAKNKSKILTILIYMTKITLTLGS